MNHPMNGCIVCMCTTNSFFGTCCQNNHLLNKDKHNYDMANVQYPHAEPTANTSEAIRLEAPNSCQRGRGDNWGCSPCRNCSRGRHGCSSSCTLQRTRCD